jgi:uncharacterized protein (TIGR02145 family)
MKKLALLLFLVFVCLAFAQKNASKNTKGTKSTKTAKGSEATNTSNDININKGTFNDSRDKKKYNTIELGGRVWMAEDLNYKKKLYSFSDLQEACPAGWRLPSKSAWEDLKKELSQADAKLKSKIGWSTQGKWWATTSSGIDSAVYYVVINSGFGNIDKLNDVKSANLSVRCIQNIQAKPSEKKNDIKLYSTVKIGSQLWMTENLNYKIGKSWCFENDDYNCNIYGRLYDWNTAIKACPSGWHLPTRREWGEVSAAEFSAKLGGNLRSEYNHAVPVNEYKFLDKEHSGSWWGITEYGNNDAYSWHIVANENNFDEKVKNKSIGYSVRCVQNIPKAGKTNNMKQYKTVQISHQVWMAENMNYKIGKSWCFEEDDFYCKEYGRLYDWNTAAKVCPAGWHLPSDSEWNELEKLSGENIVNAISASKSGWRDSDPNEYTIEQQRRGEKISRWRNLNENGTWWTSTLFETTGSVRTRHLSASNKFSSNLNEKSNGLSVRCIQNPPIKKISRVFTDVRDNKRYKVIIMGKMIWMADNLNYSAKESFCYDNKPENCDKYGRLYDWDLAQTICPFPWRLPSDEDWMHLIESTGNSKIAGEKLKSKQYWTGTDNYGFSALPGGFTKAQGFTEKDDIGYWWTSDSYGPYGKYKFMTSERDSVASSQYSKSMGLSVRCAMDCGLFNCVLE